jgi:glycosyltransferase involved in cell wall biosynthesis
MNKVLRGIKIARVSTSPFFIYSQLQYQLSMIAESGADVTVITSHGLNANDIENIPGVKFVPISIERAISPWRDFLSLWMLFRQFRKENYQIVHSISPKAGLLSAIASFLAKVPIRMHTFTGQAWVSHKGFKRWLLKSMDRLIIRLNTKCYSDSESQKQFLIQQKIALASSDISVIGNGSIAGVDLKRFDPDRVSQQVKQTLRRDLKIPDTAFVLLFVGRITKDKGVMELLDAYTNLSKMRSDVQLILVGGIDHGSGSGGEIYEESVANKEGVHLIGHTDSPEVYMHIADLLCLPSYREGFGTVIIEAAAMGLPSVASNIYGLSDSVENGVTGILFPVYNVKAIEERILELIEDPETLKKFGKEGKKRACNLFDAQKVCQLVVEEYVQLLLPNK